MNLVISGHILDIFKQYIDHFLLAIKESDLSEAERQLSLAERLVMGFRPNHIYHVYCLINRATLFNNKGNFFESLECCKIAQAFIAFKGQEDLQAKLASTAAAAHLNLGNYQDALSFTDKAIQLYRLGFNLENVANELIDKAEILLRTGDWVNAIKFVSEALAIGKRGKSPKVVADAYMKLGFVFRAHRFLYLAIDHFRDAERICRDLKHNNGLTFALYERANTWLSIGRPEETVKLLVQLQSLVPDGSPMYYFSLRLWMCVYNQQKDFKKALDCAKKLHLFFIQSKDKAGIASSLEQLGSVWYNLRDMGKAIEFGEEALKISTEIGDRLIQESSKSLIYNAKNFIDEG